MSAREPGPTAVRDASVQRRSLLHFALRRVRLLVTPIETGESTRMYTLHDLKGTASAAAQRYPVAAGTPREYCRAHVKAGAWLPR
jgi:hypothetical protein